MPCYVHTCEGPGRAEHCPLALGAAFWAARSGTDDRFRKYSRPGPKSGVGSNLVIALVLLQSQLSHSVRVPALSVGAGEGNPPAHFCKHPVPKPNGIQVIYGKQEPTHNWNRYVKRSFKRACHRAIKHGQASYKGRTLTSRTHHPTNHLPPSPLYPNPIIHSAACRYTATMWEA